MFTFGHGRSGSEDLADLLTGAGIRAVTDIRRYPGSRTNPAANLDVLREMFHAHGIGYRWEERLGGRRSLPTGTDPPDMWWQVEAFRAYAGWTRSAPFRQALAELVGEGSDGAAIPKAMPQGAPTAMSTMSVTAPASARPSISSDTVTSRLASATSAGFFRRRNRSRWVIAFLLSDEASFINGTVISIDGGQSYKY